MSLLFKLFYGFFTLMSGRHPSIFPTYHPLYMTLSLVILTAVANIISFLISSYRGFGIRCASGCHRLLRLVSVWHPMLTRQTSHHESAKKTQSPQPETNSEYVHDCVLSLCQLVYCHLPNISLWHLRKFKKTQSHLQQIPPISFVLPQLCAHGSFKITKQL